MAKKGIAKKRIAILLSITVILIGMISGTYAWFVNYQVNKAAGYDITINGGDVLQISVDNTNFYNTLDLNDVLTSVNGHTGLSDLDMIDITGDGVTFLRPELVQSNMTANPDLSDSAEWKIPENGKDYLSFKLYFRANKELSVFLGSQSNAQTASPVQAWTDYYVDENGTYKYDAETNLYSTAEIGYTGERYSKTVVDDSWNRSGYGPFSKDCIVGASRVSFVQNNDLKFIWIPKPNYILDTVNWKVNIEDELIDIHHNYYDAAKTLQNTTAVLYNLSVTPETTDGLATDPSKVVQLSDFDGEFYTAEITVNVWIEGCDNEARRALSGGRFNLDLQFVGLTE